MVGVAVRSTNGAGRVVGIVALLIALEDAALELGAGSDVGERDATTGRKEYG